MNRETKDSMIFVSASLINLAGMTESDLQEAVELVGVDAIRGLLDKGHLRYEINYEEMHRRSPKFTEIITGNLCKSTLTSGGESPTMWIFLVIQLVVTGGQYDRQKAFAGAVSGAGFN